MIDDTTLFLRLRSENAALRLSVANICVPLVLKAYPNWHLQPRASAGSTASGRRTLQANLVDPADDR